MRLLGGQLPQLLTTLNQLLVKARHFILQLLMTAVEQRQFIAHQIRRSLLYGGGIFQRLAITFCRQPLYAQHQGQAIRFGLADIRRKACVIQANQGITHLHYLPFMHEQLLDNAALEVLHLLQFG